MFCSLIRLKGFFMSLCLTQVVMQASAQTTQVYNIDSLKKVLTTTLHDTNRIWALNNLGRNYQNSDTVLLLAEQAIKLCQRIGFKKGESEAYANVGYWFNQKGDYPKALDYYLKAIRLAESVDYRPGVKRSFNSISTVYLNLKDYKTALAYARRARHLSIEQRDLFTLSLSSSWMSKAFLQLHQSDSALRFAQEGYEAAVARRESFPIYVSTARLGEIHAAQGDYNLALEYLKISLKHSIADGRFSRIAGAHQQLADLLDKTGPRDSCFWHANQAFKISKEHSLTATLLSSSLLLSKLYEGSNDAKSLHYHKLALTAQDSLFSQERNQQVEALRYSELQRQRDVEALKLKAAEERKSNLQYAAIAFGLVLLLIVFLLLSHSILGTPRLIRFFGVLALLIVFEFINLLISPLVDTLSGHSPLLMLIIMVLVAALLIPIHNRLDSWVTHKLVEKNKKIRLANAKKVIATLEAEGTDT
jgi:tetratricopeptide (TPR) repeat protein